MDIFNPRLPRWLHCPQNVSGKHPSFLMILSLKVTQLMSLTSYWLAVVTRPSPKAWGAGKCSAWLADPSNSSLPCKVKSTDIAGQLACALRNLQLICLEYVRKRMTDRKTQTGVPHPFISRKLLLGWLPRVLWCTLGASTELPYSQVRLSWGGASEPEQKVEELPPPSLTEGGNVAPGVWYNPHCSQGGGAGS